MKYIGFVGRRRRRLLLVAAGLVLILGLAATTAWYRSRHGRDAAVTAGAQPEAYVAAIASLQDAASQLPKNFDEENPAPYIKTLQQLTSICGSLQVENSAGSQENKQFKEQKDRTAKLCRDLEGLSRYSADVYTAVTPFLAYKWDPRWPSIANGREEARQRMQEIYAAAHQSFTALENVKSDMADPGKEEMQTVLKAQVAQSKASLEAVDAGTVQDAEQHILLTKNSFPRAQQDVRNFRRQFWTGFVGLEQLQAALEAHKESYCKLSAKPAPKACKTDK